MAATSEDVYKVLQSIDATLRELLALSKSKRAAPPAPVQNGTNFTPAKPFAGPTAPDADLDGPYGNPFIKIKDPRDWTGESMQGKTLSQCPPEYLDLMADRYDYFASEEPDEKKRSYKHKDAARCRGWAARLRAGWTPPQTAAGFTGGDWNADSDIKW